MSRSGWAGDITGRVAGKVRADKRAMAIEDERLRTEAPNDDGMEPITAERSRMRGQMRGRGRGGMPMEEWMTMRTNGATPSMGLSEFRGGAHEDDVLQWLRQQYDLHRTYPSTQETRRWCVANLGVTAGEAVKITSRAFRFLYNHKEHEAVKGLQKLYSGEGGHDSDSDDSCSDRSMMGGNMMRMVGSGARLLGRTKSIKANTTTADEAHDMGMALGDHIKDLHGGAFHARFAQGLANGTMSQKRVPSGKAVAKMATLPGEAREGGFGAMVYFPKSQTVGHIGKMPVRGGAKKGYHQMPDGSMMKDSMMPARGGKKRRAPAGEHDGRRKRAEIVRKVMSEKGLSMIEASKYVKAHGLY